MMPKVPEPPQSAAQERLLEQLRSTASAIGYRMLVRSIVNPDKLGHLGAVADMRGLLSRRRR